MAGGRELKITGELVEALDPVLSSKPSTPEPIVLLSMFIDSLAKGFGLSESQNDPKAASWDPLAQARKGLPKRAVDLIRYFLPESGATNPDGVRDRLYAVFVDLSRDDSIDPGLVDDVLTLGQIYWCLERSAARPRMPIRAEQSIWVGGKETTAGIKVPGANEDFATTVWADRIKVTGAYTSSGGGLRKQGARLAVLAAKHIIADNPATPPNLGNAVLKHSLTKAGKPRVSIVWEPGLATPDPLGADRQRRGLDAGKQGAADHRSVVEHSSAGLSMSTITSEARVHPNLESAVAETADRVGSPPNLHVATNRTETIHPVNFLSGAMLNPAEVGRYAVARRVDIDGDELAVDDVAARITAGETVGYLIAGAGEGKTTYLHTLCSSLMSRAIVFRWRVTGQLDWQKLRNFRDEVASIDETGSSHELPIVIVGELATKLAREQEDALIEIVQEIPSGFAATRTSIVLAGRPAWLNRIRHSVSTGHTMRLVPLCGAEAELLIKNLADAHVACSQDKGPAWTAAHFPNLGHFLAQPHASQVAVLRDGPSLVGSLLHAAYGREFIRRLTAEYAEDLEPAEQAAYLLVSFATSALGGISEELLESICHDADIERASAGSPWQRDLDRVHSARHEMIGKVVLEDKGAATASDISRMIGHIVDAAESSPEALDLLFNSVRIFEESRSLVPEKQRKTEPQFRAAIRTGILENRESWERLEQSIGPDPGEFLACAYVLHKLLPDEFGAGEKNEYLLTRTERLLTLAESAATPGSPLADRARYHRIFVNRAARRIRGDVVDDLSDIKALLPMLGQTWPEAPFYAQVVSLGLSTLNHCDLDEDESDQVAGAVLEAWQRLRVVGDPSYQLNMKYVSFVQRELFLWPVERRRSLWEAAWEFSRALANPDGDLACLLDAELVKLETSSTREDAAALRARRRRVLSETVITGQTNAEVVFRFADLAPTDETVRRVVRQVGGQVAAAHFRTPRAMALHALAIVATSDGERLDHLRAAIAAYEQSIENRDNWSARGFLWKRALRELRVLAPDEASALEPRMAAAARKFRS